MIDLGTHHSDTFNKDERKVLIIWETPNCRGEFEREGKKADLPRAISKRYTVSLNDKASLRRDLESWRGCKFTTDELKGLDLKTVLGAACQLQIVHETGKADGRTFANIAAIMALPKGTPRPKPENPLAFFSFEEAGAKPELPSGIPEWAQKIIMENREWLAAHTADTPAQGATVKPTAQTEDGNTPPSLPPCWTAKTRRLQDSRPMPPKPCNGQAVISAHLPQTAHRSKQRRPTRSASRRPKPPGLCCLPLRRGPRDVTDIDEAFNRTGLSAEQFRTACKLSLAKLTDAYAAARTMPKKKAALEIDTLLAGLIEERAPSVSLVPEREQ